MNKSFEFESDFSGTLEAWQALYQEAALMLYQKHREVALSKSMIESTLARNQLLEARREQLEQQLSDLEDLRDHRVFS